MLAATFLAVALATASPPAEAPPRPAATISVPAEGQEIRISVTRNGFEPSDIRVPAGKPVTLVITRKTDRTCAKEVVIDGYGLRAKLPLDKPVSLTFTPGKKGEIKFGCAMGMMIGGVVTVE